MCMPHPIVSPLLLVLALWGLRRGKLELVDGRYWRIRG